jgi:hypothetical protein
MKKKIITIFVLIFSFILLSGCTAISTPGNIELDGRTLTWNEVKGASAYIIKVNDDEYEASVNEFCLPSEYLGSIKVSIKAINKNKTSAFSLEYNFVAKLYLETPQNITQSANKITWDQVDGATGYVLKINGAEYLTLKNEYEIQTSEPFQVQILATGSSDGIIISSSYSSPFLVKKALEEPQNIQVSDGVISWDPVTNASKYQIIINDNITKETNISSLSVNNEFVGEVKVKVRAITLDTTNFTDSDFTEVTLNFAKQTLSAPKNLNITGGVLSFEGVDQATGYEIYANNVLLDIITTTSYNIPSEILNQDGSYLQVKALSSLHNSSVLSSKVVCKLTLISTEEELRNISPFGSYKLNNDIILSADFQPIEVFSGVFDGDNHKISGLNIIKDLKEVGFFGIIENGIVKNLTLEGEINLTITNANPNVGGLSGKVIQSEISNVTVKADINVISTNGVGTLGGITGNLERSNLSNCHYEGNISAENFIAGGFVGKASNAEVETFISQSSAVGSLTVNGGEQSFAGGFIGMLADNSLTISESFAKVDCIGTSYVGGFVGYLGSGKISNSYSEGLIKATGTLAQIGGFIGRLEGYNSKVSNCLAMTTLSTDHSSDTVLIGGFTGRTTGGTYNSIYVNNYYDSTFAPIDRIGNANTGIGDGILAKSTNDLHSGLNLFSESIWVFETGVNPKLSWE